MEDKCQVCKRPNLFSYATSELSQDAFICWLLAWADPRYAQSNKELHSLGKKLIYYLGAGASVNQIGEIVNVKVLKQHRTIDVFCLVNKTIAIIIEDKVGTTEHSNQLVRYKAIIENEYGVVIDRLIPVYIQTGDQASYAKAIEQGYQVFRRKELLELLESEDVQKARASSDILDDFCLRLRALEDDVQSFLTTPVADWSWNAWRGYYSYLQSERGEGAWEYVANASGGFLGFWWHFRPIGEIKLYLQIESVPKRKSSLCFKIATTNKSSRTHYRDRFSEEVIRLGKELGLAVTRPGRFGNGEWMTIAIIPDPIPLSKKDGGSLKNWRLSAKLWVGVCLIFLVRRLRMSRSRIY